MAIEGADELRKNLKALEKEYPEAAEASLYEEAEAIMTIAKEECPVDTGRLMNTGYVHPPSNGEVELGFGTDYGPYVHELNHPFLRIAIDTRTVGFLDRMVKRIQGRVGL